MSINDYLVGFVSRILENVKQLLQTSTPRVIHLWTWRIHVIQRFEGRDEAGWWWRDTDLKRMSVDRDTKVSGGLGHAGDVRVVPVSVLEVPEVEVVGRAE